MRKMEKIRQLTIGVILIMKDKYNLNFPIEVITKNVARLTNQLWKLIPMREHEEDWEKQLNLVKLEIVGLNEIFLQNPLFLQLLAKLEGLEISDIDFFEYRKTVFEAISLLQGVLKYEKENEKL